MKSRIHIGIIPFFLVGDPSPQGYSEWHEWAEIQYKGGLRQTLCPVCARWFFPQEKHNCELMPVEVLS